jgi:hypothetical protein
MGSNADKSMPVVFSTQTPYALPPQKFMIPTTWKRYQLSQLVNKALSLDKPVPFDFLVQGEILRVSLGEWCAEKAVGEVCLPGIAFRDTTNVDDAHEGLKSGRNVADRVYRVYHASTTNVVFAT